MANNIGVIGERDAVLAFKALGLNVVPTQSAEEASQAVNRLAKAGCAIIFITETTASAIGETISKYKTTPLPAIIPIPGSSGSNGFAMSQLRANMEKAVGANILLNVSGEDAEQGK